MSDGLRPAIYEARRDGERIAGTAAMVGRALHYSAAYIMKVARHNMRIKSGGWEIVLIAPGSHSQNGPAARLYTAERDGRRVTGTAWEVAAAIGITPEHVRKLCREATRTRDGWTVREHHGFDINPGTDVE